jgi:SAM-dependent methyltransferase
MRSPTGHTSADLAGAGYWDGVWRRSSRRSVGRFGHFRHAFARLLDRHASPGDKVCEVGCANSVWVPHLARRGVAVWGLDYSATGLERLRRQLASEGLTATLIEADLLGPQPFGAETFDLIFSLGVVEHFRDPAAPVAAMCHAVRPGGRLLTMVPNLAGVWGSLQALLDRAVYDLHVVYDRADLDAMHRAAGLTVLEPAAYFEPFGALLLHKPSLAERLPRLNLALTAAQWITQQAVAWPVSALFGARANTRTFSSSIVGVYERPA